MKLKCEICHKNKKLEKIYHFSGWIHGEFKNDIHICLKCSKKKGYIYYFVHVPKVHIKGNNGC